MPIKKRQLSENLTSHTVYGLDSFLDFCLVALRLKRKTAVNHRRRIERVLEFCGARNRGEVSTSALRSFLRTIDNDCYANNFVKSLRVYFRDYMKQGDRRNLQDRQGRRCAAQDGR